MARESCNLDKDEAEIMKPSSPSSATPVPSSSTSTSPPLCLKPCEELTIQRHERPTILPTEAVTTLSSKPKLKANAEASVGVRFINRCSTCQKKVGLTGFRCRCGCLFCGSHRYSDVHHCTFDYKTFGREEIAKANPLIRPAKIIKI